MAKTLSLTKGHIDAVEAICEAVDYLLERHCQLSLDLGPTVDYRKIRGFRFTTRPVVAGTKFEGTCFPVSTSPSEPELLEVILRDYESGVEWRYMIKHTARGVEVVSAHQIDDSL